MSTHVFLTRFNMPANKVERSIFSEEWLTERVELFRRFTIPSVKAQTWPGVRWLVFFGVHSPQWLRDEISVWESEGILTPVFVWGTLDPADLRAAIRDAVGPSAEDQVVITSNLDNDDGLAVDFCERTAKLAAGALLPQGLILSGGLILREPSVYLRKDRNNAFTAVAADLTDPEFPTCWSVWHTELDAAMPVRREDGAPAWLQVVHGRNVSNKVRGRLVSAAPYRRLFHGMIDALPAPSRRELMKASAVQPLRAGYDTARSTAARVARNSIGTDRFDVIKGFLLRRR